MKREIQYRWRVREHMARVGMKNSRDLVEPLRDRGITLSESQIYRIVGQEPERIAFSVLVALGGDSFRLDGKCSLLPCVAHPSENSKSRNTYCIRASNSSLILSYRFSYF